MPLRTNHATASVFVAKPFGRFARNVSVARNASLAPPFSETSTNTTPRRSISRAYAVGHASTIAAALVTAAPPML